MLVSTMTPQEILKEVRKDYDWVLYRTDGICRKYGKIIRKLKKGDRRILGMVKYLTPSRNTVIVNWCARKLGKTDDVYCTMFFQYMTPRGFQYIEPINNGTQIFVYTSHCCDRMLERAGMLFTDYINYYSGPESNYGRRVIIGYTYKDKDCLLAQMGNKGGFVCVKTDVGMVGVTFVGVENYSGQQVVIGAASLSEAEEAGKQLDEKLRQMLTRYPAYVR